MTMDRMEVEGRDAACGFNWAIQHLQYQLVLPNTECAALHQKRTQLSGVYSCDDGSNL